MIFKERHTPSSVQENDKNNRNIDWSCYYERAIFERLITSRYC